MPGYQFDPPRPPVRPNSPHIGFTRLAIVGGVALLAGYIFGPFVSGELGEIGRQLSDGRHTGFPPVWNMRLDETQVSPIEDRRGERGRIARPQEDNGDLASQLAPPRRQRWDDFDETSGAARTREARPYRRWRDCRVARNGGLDCGPWEDGPAPDGDAPQRRGGRWR